MRQKHLKTTWRGVCGLPKINRCSDLNDAKSSILAISWHLFPSSVIIAFYDSIFVFSTLQGKREYIAINVHKKCTKLTPE